MENSSGNCSTSDLDSSNINDSEETPLQAFELELESPETGVHRSFYVDQQFDSMDSLEILREAIRILRYDSSSLMVILIVLICPLSAIVLSNILLNESVVKKLSIKLLVIAQSSGVTLNPFIKKLCDRLSQMTISIAFSFPFYVTFSLLSRAATAYSVNCAYLRKEFDSSKFFAVIVKIWRRLVWTYLWVCMAIVGCVFLFLVLVVAICNIFSLLGLPSQQIIYPLVVVGLIFAVIFANAIIICNLAIIVSILEEKSGPKALFRSGILIQGQVQVGLLLFFMSTIGMAFLEGLYEHRVNTVSYGDGSSRLWEGPLLVFMYSFVVLIDYMMSVVFYFTCMSSKNMEASEEEEEDQNFIQAVIPTSR